MNSMNKHLPYTDEELDELAYIKKTIPHLSPNHHNPKDYGLTHEQAFRFRLRYLNQLLALYKEKCNEFHRFILNDYTWFAAEQFLYFKKLCDETDHKKQNILRLLRSPTKNQTVFDLDTIKQIPIDSFVEVSSRNTFKLRDEKTASCYWYKQTNRWHDFGTDEGGDVIDLVMKLHSCTFYEACKYLSNK